MGIQVAIREARDSFKYRGSLSDPKSLVLVFKSNADRMLFINKEYRTGKQEEINAKFKAFLDSKI
ncbi:hypothetical protein [uncultured Peptoniphilus sp.]|uniref:hypothetical protein n=1 Tax=uncultured Peptoniphilus sp. TaxID=254354 RepID=UPI002803EF9E|nr:hypothetical protein [uncultured Peptoniphilus sp.]